MRKPSCNKHSYNSAFLISSLSLPQTPISRYILTVENYRQIIRNSKLCAREMPELQIIYHNKIKNTPFFATQTLEMSP
jgi:hypothetical protein